MFGWGFPWAVFFRQVSFRNAAGRGFKVSEEYLAEKCHDTVVE